MTTPASLDSLLLPAGLRKKLQPMEHVDHLYALKPIVLRTEWRLNESQWAKINEKLRARGLRGIGQYPPLPEKAVKAASLKGKCKRLVHLDGTALDDDEDPSSGVACERPNLKGKQSCAWHWLAAQPIAEQVEAADQRRKAYDATGAERRPRVPAPEWPEGTRWCSGCQTFVPLFYTRGSRCTACASQAAHASMVKRVYDITPEDYSNLLAWQRGRCYICRQKPRTIRLAVDHDHRTGEVRGLLCANDQFGCNFTLRRLLNDVGMAQRALEYVQNHPMRRMLGGEASPEVKTGLAARVGSHKPSEAFTGFLED